MTDFTNGLVNVEVNMEGNKNFSFTANLFVGGFPVVLKYAVLEQRLQAPRLINRQRLEAEVGISDDRSARVVTLADDDDAIPLLLEFIADNNRYVIYVRSPGKYAGGHLQLAKEGRNLMVVTGEKTAGSYFFLENVDGKLTSATHFPFNPMSLALASEERNTGLYLSEEKGVRFFMDVNPNRTGHTAFNGKPVTFVLKKA